MIIASPLLYHKEWSIVGRDSKKVISVHPTLGLALGAYEKMPEDERYESYITPF